MSFPKANRIVDKDLLRSIHDLPCIYCAGTGRPQETPTEPDHITTVGAGGDDVAINLVPTCRIHHQVRHNKGIGYMVREFKVLRDWLELAGRMDILKRYWESPYNIIK